MNFSQRKGIQPIVTTLQVGGMNEDLRNSLWNVFDLFIWKQKNFLWAQHGESGIDDFSTALWFHFYKRPIDSRPDGDGRILKEIRDRYFAGTWHEVYDFVEWVLRFKKIDQLNDAVNTMLERELAGYRYIGGVIADVTDEGEVQALENALTDNTFAGVKAHLKNALSLLSDRKQPDYRNSIKESISAVESMAQFITEDRKATLGDALKVLERKYDLHAALKGGFSALYGYTSDEGGIRHAMLDEPHLDAADAKYFLLSCTSFINYLKSKLC